MIDTLHPLSWCHGLVVGVINRLDLTLRLGRSFARTGFLGGSRSGCTRTDSWGFGVARLETLLVVVEDLLG